MLRPEPLDVVDGGGGVGAGGVPETGGVPDTGGDVACVIAALIALMTMCVLFLNVGQFFPSMDASK